MYIFVKYFFIFFLFYDVELVYKIVLRVMWLLVLEFIVLLGDFICLYYIVLVVFNCYFCWFILSYIEFQQCELVFIMLIVVKGDVWRLEIVLEFIQKNIYFLLYIFKFV